MKISKINFKYSFEKDAWSWVVIARDKEDIWGLDWKKQVSFIPDNLLTLISKKSQKTAEAAVLQHLKTHYKKQLRQDVIKKELWALENVWKKLEPKFFTALEKIIQKPITSQTFGCYFTSGFMCLDNEEENWFMVSVWHSIPFQITIICHEIMHLHFLHHYKGYLKKKGLKKDEIENLKEALTFLLNEKEFEEIVLSYDSGYPEHQKLRKKLKEIWQTEKNFESFLDKAISEIKK